MKHQAFGTADETLSPDIINWIETRDENDFTAIVLEHRGQKALLLGSTNTKATSIAANFRNWLIRFEENSVEFLSLSENPDLIYWDKEGSINYWVVTYSTNFLERRDWDELTLDLLRYSILPAGNPRLVSSLRNVKCE